MKITALVENTTNMPNIKAKHGLSLYIETEKHKILFDMGSGARLLANAKRLKIDLKKVDLAILSHGHVDHGGAIGCLFENQSTGASICTGARVCPALPENAGDQDPCRHRSSAGKFDAHPQTG